jgi:carboxymethylenebutenolidase
MMIEKTVTISTPDGLMEAFVAHPQTNQPFSAVVLYMDIWGVREEIFDLARRIATVGYYCIVPDLYYRSGKVSHAFRNEKNQMVSLESLTDAQKEMVRAPSRLLTDERVVSDTAALLKFLEQEPVATGALGSVGYCMGGRHALRVAAAFPERFKANASLHGSSLVTDAVDSPHLAARQAQGELYCGFGEKDRFAAPAVVQALQEALSALASVKYSFEVHPGAEHGYAMPDRDIFDKNAFNRDWEIIFGMFRRQLKIA